MNIAGLRKKTSALEVRHGGIDLSAYPFQGGGMHWTREERFKEWEQLWAEMDEAHDQATPGIYLDKARELVVHGGRYSVQDPDTPEYILPEEFIKKMEAERPY